MKEKKKNIGEYLIHQKMMFLWIVITVGVSFVAPLKNFILQWIIDSGSKEKAFKYLCLGIGIIVLSHILEILCRNIFARMECNALDKIRNAVIHNALLRSMEVYEKEEDSAYISTLTTDIRTISDDYFKSIFNMVFFGGIMLCSLGMYAYISPWMLLVVVGISIVPIIAPKALNKSLGEARKNFSEEMKKYTQNIKEILGGFETIHLFKAETVYENGHERESKANAEAEVTFSKSLNKTIVGTSFISNMTFFIVTLFGMFMVFDGKISMGAMVTAANLANFVIQPCQMIIQNYAKLKATKAIRENVEQIINARQETGTKHISIDSVDNVSLSNVSFSYPDSQIEVVSDITMEIHKNEKIAIVGASGCGKSTIARLLCQYYERTGGKISINTIDINQITTQSLYSRIGYISQRTFLFNDTIRNNICLYQQFSTEQIKKAVELSGLSEYIHSLPQGLDTVITENGKNVSGGQMQRIGIARLLLRNYSVIIADEITANLDPATTEDIMSNLFQLNCMLIVITHDVKGSFMDKFDAVYRIENGMGRKINP